MAASYRFAATIGPLPARELLLATGLAVAAAATAMADCVIYQMAHGGAAPGLAARWLAGSVAPWAALFVILRARISGVGGWPDGTEAALLAATFLASSLADAVLIPAAGVEELGQRLWGRLPLLAAVPLAARLRLDLSRRPGLAAPVDPRLAAARLITAAGNYVEVEGADRRRLLRMTLAQATARTDAGRFVRIHRSTLVAREMIAGLERDRSGIVAVRLVDGRMLRVGRSHRARVRAAVEG